MKKSYMIRWLLLALLLFSGAAGMHAQQPSVLSLHMFNTPFYNPAFMGSAGGINANALMREQWLGYKDDEGNSLAPRTIFVTLDAPIRKIRGAVGGSIISDNIGFYKDIQVNLGYAFRMDLGPGVFSAGAQLQIDNLSIDFAKFQDHIIDEFDPVIKDGEQSDLFLDCHFGIAYEVPEKYYIGLSAMQLAQSTGKNTYYQHKRTYVLTGGYNFVVPNHPLWEIRPSAIIYYDGGSFQWNLTALVAYKKKYWGGLAYRFQQDAIILAGVEIKNFRVGLAYDISTSALTNYNSGSMEVMLGYTFKMELEKYRKRYRNTRFL